jgi:hypothetical protein
MAKKISDIKKDYNREIEARRRLIELEEQEMNSISRIFNVKDKIYLLEQKYNHELKSRNDMYDAYEKNRKEASKNGERIHQKTYEAFKKQVKIQDKKINKLRIQNNLLQSGLGIIQKMSSFDLPILSYLMDFDKTIRDTAVSIGISAERTEQLRNNFQDAHKIATRLGGTSKDLAEIQTSFANETGRAKLLSGKMLGDIIKISKGVNISSEQAGNLAGQFELVGYNATTTMNYIENVVDMSERVGVNTANIIQKLNTNFKKLQTYNFKHGVDGMARMAIYGEKYRMDMSSVLTSMDKARNLEEVIDMAANLQVLGGQFAAMADPMAMLFESRNDPEAYTKRINNMTKGLVSLRETAEGYSFELASPMARDMLDKAAKSLGLSTEELTQQAFRQKELMTMRQQMLGMNLSRDQKQLIEKLANFDNKTGKFTVTIGSEVHALTDLSQKQIQLLKTEQDSLQQRAINAQTFDDAYQATLNELKTVLLPILKGVNLVLQKARPIFTTISDFLEDQKWLAGFLGGVGIFAASTRILGGVFGGLKPLVSILGKTAKGGANYGGRLLDQQTKSPYTKSGMGKAGGSFKSSLGAGLGVGIAGVGIGGGVNLAAQGISNIADSLDKLDIEKVEALKSITTTLGVVSGIAAAAAAGIMIFGKASLVSAPGIWSFAGAVGVVVGSIGAAAAGIGVMSMGLAQLIEKGAESKGTLMDTAKGIVAINGAVATGLFGSVGLIGFAGTMGTIASSANKIKGVGEAFKSITTVLKSSSDEYDRLNSLLETINNFDSEKMSSFSKLSKIMNKPLQVEFKDKEVNLVSNITLEIDGEKFIDELNLVKRLEIRSSDIQQGKSIN